jgi:glycopeptide antibiotics resistance protein
VIWTLLYTVLLVALLVSPINKPHDRTGYLRQDPPASMHRALMEGLLNIAVFVPLGWGLHRVARQGRMRAPLAAAAIVASAFSLGVETVQYFLPYRYSSWHDVVHNTLGAFLGACGASLLGHADDAAPRKGEL